MHSLFGYEFNEGVLEAFFVSHMQLILTWDMAYTQRHLSCNVSSSRSHGAKNSYLNLYLSACEFKHTEDPDGIIKHSDDVDKVKRISQVTCNTPKLLSHCGCGLCYY